MFSNIYFLFYKKNKCMGNVRCQKGKKNDEKYIGCNQEQGQK